jgi:hypothetical protein
VSHKLSFDTTWATQKMTSPTMLLLLHVFTARETCLPSCCLAMICGDTHPDTLTDEMDAVEIGSGAMIYI